MDVANRIFIYFCYTTGMKEENVNYFDGATGFYVAPEMEGEVPGVVMIHEWFGLNDYIKDNARKLAGEGYRVLAVDLFGSVATNADEAIKLVGTMDHEKALANMQSAVAFLRQKGSEKIASMGWCMGGAQSLLLAVSGEELSATVIYYGRLITDEDQLATIRWPVLGIFAEKDDHITVPMVKDFENSLNKLGVKNEIYEYPNVGHAFARPNWQNSAPVEAADAWAKTLAFLKENLK